MTRKVIGVDINGEIEWHIVGVMHDYDTACGLDANDPTLGHQGVVEAKRSQKITCEQCRDLWLRLRELRLRQSDFNKDAS